MDKKRQDIFGRIQKMPKMQEVVEYNFGRIQKMPKMQEFVEYNGRCVKDIIMESNLRDDLGLDSFDRIELNINAEKCFNIQIPDEIFESIETVRDLVEVVYCIQNKLPIVTNAKKEIVYKDNKPTQLRETIMFILNPKTIEGDRIQTQYTQKVINCATDCGEKCTTNDDCKLVPKIKNEIASILPHHDIYMDVESLVKGVPNDTSKIKVIFSAKPRNTEILNIAMSRMAQLRRREK